MFEIVPDGATYTVSVVATSDGNKYAIDGITQYTLNLLREILINFIRVNLYDNHPFAFSIGSTGLEYTKGVTSHSEGGSLITT